MIQPESLRSEEYQPWSRGRGVDVWAMLCASIMGDLDTISTLVARDPALVECEYEYFKPIRFAVRENHPAVVEFLERIPEVERMYADIYHFVASWLPDYARDNRNYLTVAIGCTGGQHRSVYLAERLARNFAPRYQVLVRHRELE